MNQNPSLPDFHHIQSDISNDHRPINDFLVLTGGITQERELIQPSYGLKRGRSARTQG